MWGLNSSTAVRSGPSSLPMPRAPHLVAQLRAACCMTSYSVFQGALSRASPLRVTSAGGMRSSCMRARTRSFFDDVAFAFLTGAPGGRRSGAGSSPPPPAGPRTRARASSSGPASRRRSSLQRAIMPLSTPSTTYWRWPVQRETRAPHAPADPATGTARPRVAGVLGRPGEQLQQVAVVGRRVVDAVMAAPLRVVRAQGLAQDGERRRRRARDVSSGGRATDLPHDLVHVLELAQGGPPRVPPAPVGVRA